MFKEEHTISEYLVGFRQAQHFQAVCCTCGLTYNAYLSPWISASSMRSPVSEDLAFGRAFTRITTSTEFSNWER